MNAFCQKKRIVLLTVCILLPILIVIVKVHGPTGNPITVEAVQPSRANKPLVAIRSGFVEPADSVPINTEFAGTINEVYVKAGQAVKAGQPLFKYKAVASPAADSQSQAVTQRTAPKTGQDNYDNALKEFTRYQKLYEIGGISKRQMEEAKARLQKIQEGSDGSQNPVEAAKASAVPAGPVIAAAPADGIVAGVTAIAGKPVQAGQQVMTLGSGQEFEIAVHLDQADLYLVHLGSAVSATVSGQAITGQISRIYPEVKANQVSSFLAHSKLMSYPAGLLQTGMPAAVRMETGKTAAVLAVPSTAILRDEQNQDFVYVVANGKAVHLSVIIGENIGDLTEITSDIPSDSLVIINNLDKIKQGDPVQIN